LNQKHYLNCFKNAVNSVDSALVGIFDLVPNG